MGNDINPEALDSGQLRLVGTVTGNSPNESAHGAMMGTLPRMYINEVQQHSEPSFSDEPVRSKQVHAAHVTEQTYGP